MAVIYLTEQGATLTKTDGRMVVRKGKEVLLDIPAFKIDQVVIFGNGHLTTPAVNFCLEEGIDVCFLSSWGKYRGRLQPELCKDARLRQIQYQRSLEPGFCLEVSQGIATGKIRNTLAFCQRQREQGEGAKLVLRKMTRALHRAAQARNLESLRGYEGSTSVLYYGLLKGFLKEDWGFTGRTYHPPTDPVNILLSLGYTLLYNNFYAALNVVGLDPYQGFFHQNHPGHAALASDLMEEFRAILVDSVVLSALNKEALQKRDFSRSKDSKVQLSQEGLRKFISMYDGRLRTEVVHPALGVRTSYRRCLELQARHLVKVILGEETGYHPFQAR